MQPVPQNLLKEYVQSQHFTSTTEIMEAMKEMFRDVIQTVMENGQEFCLAIDERGLYLTSANYLDKNLADPHRYSGSRATTKARLLALDLDPVRLAEANAHRIPVYTDEAKKKINPIKASKRGLRG